MVIINVETGDYEVDETRREAAKNLQAKSPYARVFCIGIGYNVEASFGSVMERVDRDFTTLFRNLCQVQFIPN
ncbi:hypothetical protein PN482_20870 [Microcystis aeruginosa CS-555/01A07]|jgi:hypothetical protein|uniref:hypothetical protein n=1 Tax=Microcystis aeruginosa TaxID=1126 RepID=UPI001D14729D|nr:hypothetical protein [Microcystis aeruginosa]MDB9431273.1 hypothetical protein [Microcystis aeruginosa CS-555/01A07]